MFSGYSLDKEGCYFLDKEGTACYISFKEGTFHGPPRIGRCYISFKEGTSWGHLFLRGDGSQAAPQPPTRGPVHVFLSSADPTRRHIPQLPVPARLPQTGRVPFQGGGKGGGKV